MAKGNTKFWDDIHFNNSHKMAAIGVGTDRMLDYDTLYAVMDEALSSGCRTFDIGVLHGNEKTIGRVFTSLLQKYELTREQLFIASKLQSTEHRDKKCVYSLGRNSFEQSKLIFLDLCLAQCPLHLAQEPANLSKSQQAGNLKESTWAGIVELYEQGLVDSVGVSNYSIDRLNTILSSKSGIIPALNQVELNPLKYDRELLTFCSQNDIAVQGYHLLGGPESKTLLNSPQVKSIAKDLSAVPAQVLLTWGLQKGCAVLVKSTKRQEIRRDIDLTFKLDGEQMSILDKMSGHKEKVKQRQYHSRKKN